MATSQVSIDTVSSSASVADGSTARATESVAGSDAGDQLELGASATRPASRNNSNASLGGGAAKVEEVVAPQPVMLPGGVLGLAQAQLPVADGLTHPSMAMMAGIRGSKFERKDWTAEEDEVRTARMHARSTHAPLFSPFCMQPLSFSPLLSFPHPSTHADHPPIRPDLRTKMAQDRRTPPPAVPTTPYATAGTGSTRSLSVSWCTWRCQLPDCPRLLSWWW